MAGEKKGNSGRAGAAKSEWIDVSLPLYDSMVQGFMEPLTPHFEFVLSRSKGNKVAMYQISINSHNGTHVDAPYHFVERGQTVDKMPLDKMIGPARVIEIADTESIKPAELLPHNIQPGERILFKTKNSSRPERMTKFFTDNVYLSLEGARFLIRKKISVVGIDYISIAGGGMDNIDNTHIELLDKGIYIIEDLDLSKVKAGRYEMICLPLRIQGGDASPVRAILRSI
jgi:arylformamidase